MENSIDNTGVARTHNLRYNEHIRDDPNIYGVKMELIGNYN